MTYKIGELSVLGICLVLIAVLIGVSCKERTVPFIIDEVEIERYIEISNIGQQFFQRTNLIMPDTFRVAGDPSSIYSIVVDSVTRDLDISTSETSRTFSFDFLGGVPYRDADVMVTDKVYYKTVRVSGIDTIRTSSTTQFSRYGWFAKVGDDSHPFAGWTLYGYCGGSPFGNTGVHTFVNITAPNNYMVSGDSLSMSRFFYTENNDTIDQPTRYVYELITDTAAFLKIPGGVTIDAEFNAYSVSSYALVTTHVGDEFITRPMTRNGGKYNYSLAIPADELSHWYLIVFFDVRSTSTKIWCVPYRIWP